MPQLRPELSAYASLGQGTNNSAELYAVGVVIDIELKEGDTQPLHIYTDSNYERGCLTEGWKTRKNVKLVENIIHLLEETKQAREVHLVWVNGHANCDGNERADKLANTGAEMSKEIDGPSEHFELALSDQRFNFVEV